MPIGLLVATTQRPGSCAHSEEQPPVLPFFRSELPTPAAIGHAVTMVGAMHGLSGAEAIYVAVTAAGFREALAMHGFGVAHLVALRCVPLLRCDLCVPFHAALIGSFFPGGCVRRLRRSARRRCTFVLRCGLIAALSRSGDRKGEEAKHGCCRQNFTHVGSP